MSQYPNADQDRLGAVDAGLDALIADRDRLLFQLELAVEVMDRARSILQRDGAGWGMLDTTDARAAIAHTTKHTGGS